MADLSGFANKQKSDEGVIFPVSLNGVKLPIAIKVYGSNSDVVKQYKTERLRKIRLNQNGIEIDDDIAELLDSNESVVIRMGGVYSYDWDKGEVIENEPITLNNRTIKCDKASYNYLLDQIEDLSDWVMKKSNSKTDFLASGTKN